MIDTSRNRYEQTYNGEPKHKEQSHEPPYKHERKVMTYNQALNNQTEHGIFERNRVRSYQEQSQEFSYSEAEHIHISDSVGINEKEQKNKDTEKLTQTYCGIDSSTRNIKWEQN